MVRNTLLLWLGLAITLTSTAGAISPVNLRCEYRVDPLGIDALRPRLSWQFTTQGRNVYQGAYQVQVATTPEILAQDKPDLWDSGKVDSDQSVHVDYGGRPLVSRQHCTWRVRVWDKNGRVSPWSEPAHWSMGILRPQDWRSLWIAAHNGWSYPSRKFNGYHSEPAPQPQTEKWVQVDLQQTAPIEQVRLHPATLPYELEHTSFGFPLRFRVEVADDPGFANPRIVADHTGRDYGPVPLTPQVFAADGVKARYVRVTATRLWNRDTDEKPYYCFAMGAIEVIADGQNIALNKPVSAMDAVESVEWTPCALTDYRNLLDESVPYNLAPTPYAAMWLRKEAMLDQDIARATATVCGLGYYELYLNGRKVGNHVMDPGFTDYDKRAQYVSYNVTDQLRRGENAIGVILGNGWLCHPAGELWGFYQAPWASEPKLCLEIEVEYKDGKKVRIVSDESWSCSASDILNNCVRAGEIIDAAQRQPGWNTPGFDDSAWGPVKKTAPPAGKLVSQSQPPIRVTESIRPAAVTQPKPGVYVVDMGRNMTGWASLEIKGRPGQMISLHYNERLNPDGTLCPINREFTCGPFQRDIFLCSGGKDTFEPRFTYHGFRYIQIEGLDQAPDLDSLKGQFVHTDPEPAGTFACSNELINRIHEICLRTVHCNMHSIPTDCPHREKVGWMQDGCVAQETAIYNMSMATFYTKWFRDMTDTQESSGYVSPIAPDPKWGRSGPNDAPTWASGPWWSGAIVRTPWKLYQYYGDRRILEEGYESMKLYVDYLTSRAEGHCINFGLGDWLEEDAIRPKRTPAALSNTAAYAWYAQIVANTAAVLGRAEDARHYETLAQSIRTAFNERFVDPDTGLKVQDSQAGPALALYLGVAQADKRSLLEEQLRDSIRGKRNNHVSSGIVGTLYVFYQLTEQGDSDLAYLMATQRDYPSWGYMLSKGATTVWEQWPGIEASHNHPALASVDAWFYRALAGIRPDPAAPGFKRFIVQPHVVGDLTWAKASYDSVAGTIVSHWQRDRDTMTLNVTVPANTQARVILPATDAGAVRESDQPLNQHPEITVQKDTASRVTLTVGSGDYRFTFPMAQ